MEISANLNYLLSLVHCFFFMFPNFEQNRKRGDKKLYKLLAPHYKQVKYSDPFDDSSLKGAAFGLVQALEQLIVLEKIEKIDNIPATDTHRLRATNLRFAHTEPEEEEIVNGLELFDSWISEGAIIEQFREFEPFFKQTIWPLLEKNGNNKLNGINLGKLKRKYLKRKAVFEEITGYTFEISRIELNFCFGKPNNAFGTDDDIERRVLVCDFSLSAGESFGGCLDFLIHESLGHYLFVLKDSLNDFYHELNLPASGDSGTYPFEDVFIKKISHELSKKYKGLLLFHGKPSYGPGRESEAAKLVERNWKNLVTDKKLLKANGSNFDEWYMQHIKEFFGIK